MSVPWKTNVFKLGARLQTKNWGGPSANVLKTGGPAPQAPMDGTPMNIRTVTVLIFLIGLLQLIVISQY